MSQYHGFGQAQNLRSSVLSSALGWPSGALDQGTKPLGKQMVLAGDVEVTVGWGERSESLCVGWVWL